MCSVFEMVDNCKRSRDRMIVYCTSEEVTLVSFQVINDLLHTSNSSYLITGLKLRFDVAQC